MITVPISPGELLDKITILAIKRSRITDGSKRSNVEYEHQLLTKVAETHIPANTTISQLMDQLLEINQALWDVEDRLRELEKAGEFGPNFVENARSVYIWNDRRAAVKKEINLLLGSAIVEEKSYADYSRETSS